MSFRPETRHAEGASKKKKKEKKTFVSQGRARFTARGACAHVNPGLARGLYDVIDSHLGNPNRSTVSHFSSIHLSQSSPSARPGSDEDGGEPPTGTARTWRCLPSSCSDNPRRNARSSCFVLGDTLRASGEVDCTKSSVNSLSISARSRALTRSR